jgi:Flp pilus assembly protein TadG
MNRSRIRTLRSQEGAVAITIAILLVVLMAAVALTVDAGGLYLRRRALVNGSDAAALSAARTCARAGIVSDPFATPEEAADHQVQANAPITANEVAGTNITDMTGCGQQSGHVSVQYTSQQGLYFAPVLGFDRESPVTTTATASWGFGDNNVIPIVLSSLVSTGPCSIPPSGTPAIGEQCAFWYDNDRLGGGNFAFLSLNPDGWNVEPDSTCNQSGGTSTLTQWINGIRPASVTLNWTDPTYVCTDSGIKGVGGNNGPNSQLWSAVDDLIGQTKDFPINWEGPGAPPYDGAPEQGMIFQSGQIDKYDIIGFAALRIVDVVSVNDAQGGVGSCHTKNNQPVSWTDAGNTLDLDSITSATSGWQGCSATAPVDAITSLTVTNARQNEPACCTLGVDYTYDALTRTITWIGNVPKDTAVSFDWLIDPNNGPCGQLPSNSSAMCLVTEWQGSTLTGDYQGSPDNLRVVRLCDRVYGTCLDQ